MKTELTAPMQKVMTPQLMQRIERTLDEFPELQPHTLRIGLVMHSNVHGESQIGPVQFAISDFGFEISLRPISKCSLASPRLYSIPWAALK